MNCEIIPRLHHINKLSELSGCNIRPAYINFKEDREYKIQSNINIVFRAHRMTAVGFFYFKQIFNKKIQKKL